MNASKERNRLPLAVLLLTPAVLLAFTVSPALGHDHGGYSHDDSIGTSNPDWMASLPDQLRLSELSLPGTHDTGAYAFGGDIVETQAINEADQLDAGIRALDVRCHHVFDRFAISHGPVFQGHYFSDVLEDCIDFLGAHPGEVILMRVKEEDTDLIVTRSFADTFAWYMDRYGDAVWEPGTALNPTLGEVRGKIVILQNFSSGVTYGLDWSSMNIQDEFAMDGNWELYDKWGHVLEQLYDADGGSLDTFFVNFLSGASSGPPAIVFPYFVASGHLFHGTGDSRLSTGKVDPITCDSDCWPDFPRVACYNACPVGLFLPCSDLCFPGCLNLCTVAYEGTNILTTEYIENGSVDKRIGIIMADFPGPDLVDEIIGLNPWNWPPEADAGGPYVINEGAQLTLDAGGSTDRDGHPLTYRWDFDGDGTWDRESGPSATVTHVYLDDWIGNAMVGVTDSFHEDAAEAAITVNNVAPIVTATGTVIDEDSVATVSGTITDPGVLDSFTVVIDWGEGAPVTYQYPAATTTFSESHQYLDENPTGTPSDNYAIGVTVTDKDGGMGRASTTVTVHNINPVTSIDHVTDETGSEIGVEVPVALELVEVAVAASFTDVGTVDTHTAYVSWGDAGGDDLGSTTGAIAATHVYMGAGVYPIVVTVTDDDTGVGNATRSITVVDAEGAIMVAIEGLTELAADPSLEPEAAAAIGEAMERLEGENGGEGENGALDMLEKGNLNAALVGFRQAIEELKAAEAADSTIDLTFVKSLLALSTKSVVLDAIATAEAVASRASQWTKIGKARDHVAQGDERLQVDLDYVGAVELYRDALQRVWPARSHASRKKR